MSMSCEEAQRAIVWLLDDEIDPTGMLEIEEHVDGCEACRTRLQRESKLRQTVRRAGATTTAPPRLRRHIRQVLDNERKRQGPFAQLWPAAAAAAILLALLWKGSTSGVLPDLDEAAQMHANLPLDVVSADVGEVQRFFEGKVPFSVQLPQVTGSTVRSFGGRVTHLRDRQAAYVRYDMPRSRVAVFVYQDPGNRQSELEQGYRVGQRQMAIQRVRGYTIARWRSSGLVYSVVTDLPPNEIGHLLEFPQMRR